MNPVFNLRASRDREINKSIEEARYKPRKYYQQLQMQNKLITAEAIKNLFLGETKSETRYGDRKFLTFIILLLNKLSKVYPFCEE